jgi:hypothetical protein
MIITCSLLTAAGLAWADDTTSGYSGLEKEGQPREGTKLEVNPGFLYAAQADIDNGGDVSVWRFDVPVNFTRKYDQKELGIKLQYEYSYYDFGGFPTLDDQKFNTLALNANWRAMIDDKWGYFLFGGLGLSASTDAQFSEGLTGMGGAGAQYAVSTNVVIGLGGGIGSQLEDDARFLPVILVNWQINERWALRVFNGATISYDLNGDKSLVLDLGANYQRRQYRLTDDAAAIDRQVNLEIGATARVSETFGVRAFLGVAAGRNFEVRQSSQKLGDEDVDATPYLGLRALFTF